MKKTIIGFGGVVFIALLAIVGAYINLKWGEDKEFIRDAYNDKQLVEYYHVDLNISRLSIITDGNKRWIKHPICCLPYYPSILDNEIVFDRSNSGFLLVNGESFKIENIDEL